ncbi:adenylate/guanylate cyclase domain-containing protein [Epibacterium sp. Ofav1-8]|uniref:adenylate/guanylate cyclase domain-containing protein n=1 Tax=Epibacterium sp. Ofav1-8 TaxID=2917735 RepID=UPI001EF50AFB|nr:adenylate/guanylate cyclase domain-containing protein [Epibacterium sp. Ofav1-8]MCG7624551.1 adenylate/guanylate cyclase domain-containing protein [Epibacterium sp. Ofav1-8]
MTFKRRIGRFFVNQPHLINWGLALAILALPVVVWLDLMAITDQSLRRQGQALDAVLDTVRGYYARNVIARLDPDGQTIATHDYHDRAGAIPIPATMSIELGDEIAGHGLDVSYRFASDYPFAGRETVTLTSAEERALSLYRDGSADHLLYFRGAEAGLFSHHLTMVTPVVMEEACVACHNSHPDSTKTDWQVGDIRGVQSYSIAQQVATSLFSFSHLLLYMVVVGGLGILFAVHQLRLAQRFRKISEELSSNNEFLAGISMKISRYLSPQVYRSIFSGEKDASISTERKKLTVFFSDIKDFTQTAETLQPEELTALLNEYFTEMSAIAAKHGATIDKFIGDAIVAFFGDPETLGTAEDARACVRMALEMQERLAELEQEWRARGIDRPFRARIGINTGYCNVGNFGSEARMDYTIIGAEANLAARLEAAAEPGGIVMSHETYAHVRDFVAAEPMPPMQFKGITRDVHPYAIAPGRAGTLPPTEASADGKSLTVHLDRLDEATRRQLQALLDKPAKG